MYEGDEISDPDHCIVFGNCQDAETLDATKITNCRALLINNFLIVLITRAVDQ